MQGSLVDLAYSCEVKFGKAEEVKSLVVQISNTLRAILSTSDPESKLQIAKDFFTNQFPKIKKLKMILGCKIEKDVHFIYDDFSKLMIDEAQAQGFDVSNKESLTEKLVPLQVLKQPFADVSGEPFDAKSFMASFQRVSKDVLHPFFERVFHYQAYFRYLKYLKEMIAYECELKGNKPPSVSASTNAVRKPQQLKTNLLPLQAKSKEPKLGEQKSPIIRSGGLLKIESPSLCQNTDNKTPSHQGVLSLDGIFPQHRRTRSSTGNISNLPIPPKLADYDLKIQKLEADKKLLQDKNDTIETLYRQKSLLLQKEIQILRENCEILLHQKDEMQKYYEQHISALMKELKYLQIENTNLKEKAQSIQPGSALLKNMISHPIIQ
ncbi:hypothetical protein GPJ56_009529 [Histomonas meleagridis]|uniref:uncharacterized protein n=1 Tax=Histomonas meleagridis TaxID=135588 RepID=UPI00355A2CED|nr:hypothetical protein GPJ56_009529 [Histomonas meleagridis]KAH0797187.1 hypothetical protein GO595_010045 [Histomonas meleagridis]